MSIDDLARELLATPPREFVAARNARVKELKAAGERELAAAVGKLRRIAPTDWALNVAAADSPDVVDRFAAAAIGVIEAQEAAMSGRSGPVLRDALQEVRHRTSAVVAATQQAIERHGATGSGSGVAEITSRLATIGGNRSALELLRRGLLGAEDPGTVDPFAGDGPAADAGGAADAARRAKRPPTSRRERRPTGTAPAARETKTAAAAAAAAAERRRREAELTAAERALTKTEAAIAKASVRVAEAESRLASARDDLDAATVAGEAARRRRDDAARALERAD